MSKQKRNWVLVAGAVAAMQALGCQASVRGQVNAATVATTAAGTCAAPGQPMPTFDWEPARRQAFDRAARGGVVVLRAQGCDWVVLEGCHVSSGYDWQPGFSRASSHGGRGGHLGVDLAGRASGGTRENAQRSSEVVTVGRKELSARGVSFGELRGSCDGATHVVSSIAVGAFRITTEGKSTSHVGIGSTALVSNESWRGSVRQEGQPERCTATAGQMELGCSAAIEVAFAPIAAQQPADAHVAGANTQNRAEPSSATAPTLTTAVDPCAAGDAAACAAQCSTGTPSACTALTFLCARGDTNACAIGGARVLLQAFAMAR